MSTKKNQPSLIGSSGDSLREAFGKELVRCGKTNKNFIVLDADIAGGTGAHHFREEFPERFYQCGIAEQNMIAMAGGIASENIIPIVTTFAVFSLRGFEQTRLSIAYTKRNVKIVASHPGLDVGPDGASAQALEDISAYRALPNMVVISPADPLETALATKKILEYTGPVYMRSGRSNSLRLFDKNYNFEIGKGNLLREGTDVAIIACGVEVARSLKAAEILQTENISAAVINMATIKPIDEELLIFWAKKTGCIVSCEDHNVIGGLGSAISECLAQNYPVPQEYIGVRDVFGESGEPEELAQKYGLTEEYIVNASKKVIKRKSNDIKK